MLSYVRAVELRSARVSLEDSHEREMKENLLALIEVEMSLIVPHSASEYFKVPQST